MSTYKLLDHSFRRAKWHYRLLERNGMAAIYEQRASAKPDKISGYAVARIRRVEGKTMPNGNKIPPREIFPSPSEFGFNGWYYMSNPESKKMAYEQYHAKGKRAWRRTMMVRERGRSGEVSLMS